MKPKNITEKQLLGLIQKFEGINIYQLWKLTTKKYNSHISYSNIWSKVKELKRANIIILVRIFDERTKMKIFVK